MTEETKKVQLRKHKRLATGLFFFMALVYGVMVYLQYYGAQPWMGYVEAFSEAGMVGGDPDVGREHHLEAAAHAVAVHHGDPLTALSRLRRSR